MEVLRKLKLVRGVQIWYVETYKIICYNFIEEKNYMVDTTYMPRSHGTKQADLLSVGYKTQ